MVEFQDYIYMPADTTVGAALCAYLEREGQWWWLLITKVRDAYRVCTFGSLLPYLTGQADHIVHAVGDCPICSALDPMIWTDTADLVEEVLADPAGRSRRIGDLPMYELHLAPPIMIPAYAPADVAVDEIWRGPNLSTALCYRTRHTRSQPWLINNSTTSTPEA
jgi:hypothetical protein